MDKKSTGIMLCSECKKFNIAMQLLKGLSWRGSEVQLESILGYDKVTETILVDEKKFLRLIQLANPIQPDKKIKLV